MRLLQRMRAALRGRHLMRSFTVVLQEALARRRALDQRKGEQPAWYPSVISFGCDRRAVLNRAGIEGNPFDAITLRKFWMGESIHAAFQGLIEKSFDKEGVEVLGNEVEVRDQAFSVAGRIDTLVKVEGDIEVWEFKSAASRSFSYGDFPREDHILQVGIYLTFPATCQGKHDTSLQGKLEFDFGCDHCNASVDEPPGKMPLPQRARLIYFSKDDARTQEFVIEPTPELIGKVKETLARLTEAYEQYKADGTLPDPIPLVEKKAGKWVKANPVPEYTEGWRVKYCEYRGTGRCCGDNRDESDTERDGSSEGEIPEERGDSRG